jgi:hypothetical protein
MASAPGHSSSSYWWWSATDRRWSSLQQGQNVDTELEEGVLRLSKLDVSKEEVAGACGQQRQDSGSNTSAPDSSGGAPALQGGGAVSFGIGVGGQMGCSVP